MFPQNISFQKILILMRNEKLRNISLSPKCGSIGNRNTSWSDSLNQKKKHLTFRCNTNISYFFSFVHKSFDNSFGFFSFPKKKETEKILYSNYCSVGFPLLCAPVQKYSIHISSFLLLFLLLPIYGRWHWFWLKKSSTRSSSMTNAKINSIHTWNVLFPTFFLNKNRLYFYDIKYKNKQRNESMRVLFNEW